ncbi:cell division protein ZapA [Thaumasiovibrio subtropicus]|uniref:cell division protein ZapA n=1 Tax=Thaumasiovibrio subtropicus TaxID=1891207 RepID=UPI000B3546B2|nr:cell division protein ZapA [Thaumasiovibrio subtropicus]
MTTQAVEIEIMGKALRVNCPEGEEEALREAAADFDGRLQALSDRTKMTNTEQLLIFTALNICHELHNERKSHQTVDWDMSTRLGQLDDKLSKALKKSLEK